jgi:death-on-curing protein
VAPTFLTLEDVMALHTESISRFGGAHGVRDVGGLESALAMPQATMFGQFLHPTLEEKAAAYLFHLVMNHPFLDGNKRTGLAAALAFLGINDVRIVTTSEALVELTLGVAKGERSKSDVAVFLKEHSTAW